MVQPINSPSDVPVVPVSTFFANPERTNPKLSPNGKLLAYLAVDDNKVLQIFVQPLKDWRQDTSHGVKQVSHHPSQDLWAFMWTLDSTSILFLQDKGGNEDHHLFRVKIDGDQCEEEDLTPFPGVGVSGRTINGTWFLEHRIRKNTGIVALNKLEVRRHDLYHVDLETGDVTPHTVLPDTAQTVLVDQNHLVRAATCTESDGSFSIQLRNVHTGDWDTIVQSTPLDTVSLVSWNNTRDRLVFKSSVGRESAVLIEMDPVTKTETIVAEGAVDVYDYKLHPWTNEVQMVCFNPGRAQWVLVDESLQDHFEALLNSIKRLDADMHFVENIHVVDDSVWVVCVKQGNAPASYYLYHLDPSTTAWSAASQDRLEFLFTTHPHLSQIPLGRMDSIHFSARDGLPLQAYVTYPPFFQPSQTYPTMLWPHGGPWCRDTYGYCAAAQWLANRGFIVIEPNYRGSVGFNKRHLTSSFKQWGKAMQTDLIDAVEHLAVTKGVVDKDNVGIMGTSYGGYCALVGVTQTPEYFKCAVDVVGPSNLKTLLATFPPYWASYLSVYHTRMGHPEMDSDLLDDVSPVNHCDKIIRPLMVIQGQNDPRVKVSESEQIVNAIDKTGGSVVYVLYNDEGHGFTRPVNRVDHKQKVEYFLSKCFGDKMRVQPGLSLENVPGSSAKVRVVGKGF